MATDVPSVRLNVGRARRRTRGGILDTALLAAGEPGLLLTHETTRSSPCERFFAYHSTRDEACEWTFGVWPTEAGLDAIEAVPLFRDQDEAVYRVDGTLALVSVSSGFVRIRLAGKTVSGVEGLMAAFREALPMTFVEHGEDPRIPITFWTCGAFGPEQRLRLIETASWADVEGNYPASVRDALALLLDPSFDPGRDGQLLLWEGPPGTGKTWALRALASEWRDWAEFSYITDPDTFFVDRPGYMIDVLLADSYGAVYEDGGVYEEVKAESKWRVLILEDTGELLSANAKEKYGQGLSRLLNVVDGMIGQGLRVLCLVTTNDELGELNEAVRRPGRCASQIVFPAFTPEEAAAWLGEPVEGELTLAEMYARRGEAADAIPERDHPDDPEPEDARDLMAAAAPAPDPDEVVQEVVRVAEAHQDDAIGYGETAFKDGVVYWIHGDWTDHDPARADFLAVEGVNDVVCEAESIPDGWPYENVVYPPSPSKWVTTPPEASEQALADLVAFAAEPLK